MGVLLFRKLGELIQLRYIQRSTTSKTRMCVLELFESILAPPDGCNFHTFSDEALSHRLANAGCSTDEEDMLVR